MPPADAASPAASTAPAVARIVPRVIIALFDGNVDRQWRDTALHQMAEMPLNHLGLIVEPHDINAPLPEIANRDDVRGVITWWRTEGLPAPAAFLDWAVRAVDGGKRFVTLGALGFLQDRDGKATPRDQADRLLRRLGWRFHERSYAPGYTTRAISKDSWMVEFERRLPAGLSMYEAVERTDPDVRVHLQVERPRSQDAPFDLVVTSRHGGYAAQGYTHHYDPETGARQWLLNPFAFFRDALATDEVPKPDVTTAAGRRLYFSHVDGDGWRNLTDVQPYREAAKRAIDVLIDRAYAPFPDLPVTVAPIAGDLDPDWCGDAAAQHAARRVFALPHVEAASHSYSHPYHWSRLADNAASGAAAFGSPGCGSATSGLPSEPGTVLTRGEAVHDERHAARAYPKGRFDLELELTGAARYIGRFLPPGKTVTLIQWSGDALPFPAAIRGADHAGLRNINGGDVRFDDRFPSVAWVSPIGRHADGAWQVYAAASNENTYTGRWTRPLFGFRRLVDTLQNTESPRRLKPINIYYHVYSGEKLAGVNALLENLRYAQRQSIAPIAASRYAAIADGFYQARLTRVGPQAWRIENRGALQTMRFDNAAALQVDFNRSKGVIGQRHHQDSLYVSLDGTHETAVVALGPDGSGDSLAGTPARPYLVHSRWLVSGLKLDGDSFGFDLEGFGSGDMAWKVPRPGRYEVTISEGGRRTRSTVERGSDGTINVGLSVGAPLQASVRIVPVNTE